MKYLIKLASVAAMAAAMAFSSTVAALAGGNILMNPDGFFLDSASSCASGHACLLYGPSQLGGYSSHWHVTQWGSPTSDLPAFVNNLTANAMVHLTRSPGQIRIAVHRHAGALCYGVPQPGGTSSTEFDSFMEPNFSPYVVSPWNSPAPYAGIAAPLVSSMTTLTHKVSVYHETPVPYANSPDCTNPANTNGNGVQPAYQDQIMTTIELVNTQGGQPTFFWQIILNSYHVVGLGWFPSPGQIVYSESVQDFGAPYVGAGQTVNYSMSLLNKLKTAITAAGAGSYITDTNYAHWQIVGAYTGIAEWGHMFDAATFWNWKLSYT